MTIHVAHSDILHKTQQTGECRHFRLGQLCGGRYDRHMKLRIRDLRRAAGLTQKQLAEKAGISVSYMTEIEGGKKQVNARLLQSIATALCVAPRDLILDDSLSDDQRTFLSRWDALKDAERKVVENMMDTIIAARDQSKR